MLNSSVPNAVENSLKRVIVTLTNLVGSLGQSYDARIAGHWPAREQEADAGTLFREARAQA
jgi:hypothetical protein